MDKTKQQEYTDEPIKRLKNNHYAMVKAHQRLKEAIKMNHDEEIYTATGEMLLWVMTTNEWHLKHNKGYKSRRNKSEKGQVLFGLLHAYNSMKHNMDFIRIHKAKGGFSLPLEFPLVIPPLTIHWMRAGELLEGDRPGQKKNYEKYIEGEEVLSTFEIAVGFLNEEFKSL